MSSEPITPPKLDGQPDFPEPGIYFGMPDDVYHSIHACSATGIKNLSVSSMDYWASSLLNPEREDDTESFARTLGHAYHCRICEGAKEYILRYAPSLEKDDYPDLIVTVADIRKAIDDAGGKPKGTAKDALIEQLLELNPSAKVWDRMVAEHAEANADKTIIGMKYFRRIEIAAAMIMGDPALKQAFTGGHPEVSIFWYDEATGCPMKARIDYLKMNAFIDLKSFSNKGGKPIQRAIDMAISSYKYYIPVVVYLEAIEAAKKMILQAGSDKNRGLKTVARWQGGEPPEHISQWLWSWAHQPEPEALFVFQQTGKAPVTRGRIMHRGTTFAINDSAVQFLKRKWVRCAQTFGTDPWIDIEPVSQTVDENLNWSATDFGDTA